MIFCQIVSHRHSATAEASITDSSFFITIWRTTVHPEEDINSEPFVAACLDDEALYFRQRSSDIDFSRYQYIQAVEWTRWVVRKRWLEGILQSRASSRSSDIGPRISVHFPCHLAETTAVGTTCQDLRQSWWVECTDLGSMTPSRAYWWSPDTGPEPLECLKQRSMPSSGFGIAASWQTLPRRVHGICRSVAVGECLSWSTLYRLPSTTGSFWSSQRATTTASSL